MSDERTTNPDVMNAVRLAVTHYRRAVHALMDNAAANDDQWQLELDAVEALFEGHAGAIAILLGMELWGDNPRHYSESEFREAINLLSKRLSPTGQVYKEHEP